MFIMVFAPFVLYVYIIRDRPIFVKLNDCKLQCPGALINIVIKKKCGLIPQIFFADFSHRAKQIDNNTVDFIAVIPKEVTRGASSIEILVGGGISGGNDVINGVKRHVHG